MAIEGSERRSPFGDVGQWVGVLLGGFVGAVTFLGIQGSEIGVILRNESWRPGVVALILALAIMASVVSVFVRERSVHWLLGAAALLAATSLAPLMTRLVPTPATTPDSSRVATHMTTGIGAMSLLFLIVWLIRWRKQRRIDGARWPLQAVVLLLSVILLSIAVYSGLRLETSSQYETTFPQVTSAWVVSSQSATITLSVEAEKMRADDEMALAIYGLPRDTPLGNDEKTPCTDDRCEFVAGAELAPDSFGVVHDSLEFPVDHKAYAHLAIVVEVKGPTIDTRRTTLDMRVPTPATTAADD